MTSIRQDQSTANDLQVTRFEHRDESERVVARVVRLQLNYWVLRTMIENARRHEGTVSDLMIEQAKAARVQGFRDEVKAFDSGLTLASGQPIFDDEILQQAGTRIGYLLPTVRASLDAGEGDRAVAVLNEALTIEEEIVTMEVYRALYGVDMQRMAA